MDGEDTEKGEADGNKVEENNEDDDDVVVVEEDYFSKLEKLVLCSPQNNNKIITRKNIKVVFNKNVSKYSPFYACIEPSVHGETKTFVCLLCASILIVKKRETGLKLFKGKTISQNFRSHAAQMHEEVLGTDEKKVKPLLELLMHLFGKKVGKETLVNLTETELQQTVEGTTYFKAVSTGIARVRQALWLMTNTLSSTVVDDEFYRSFMRCLSKGFDAMLRQTESQTELATHGFCVKQKE